MSRYFRLALVLAFALLGGLLLGGLAIADGLLWRAPSLLVRLKATASAAGAGVCAGLVLGAGIGLLVQLLEGRARAVRASVWLLAGGLSTALLCGELDVWLNLKTDYAKLAKVVAAGASLLGLCVARIGYRLTSPEGRGRGPLPGRLRRWAARALLLLVASACALVDRTQYPDQYAAAHVALQLTTWFALLGLGAPLLGTARRLAVSWRRAVLGSTALLALLPWFILTPKDTSLLQHLMTRPFPGLSLSLLRELSDFDRDGYSSFLGGVDCAPFSPRINPSAAEIPRNGIDENCLGGDAKSADETELSGSMPTEPSPSSVVLITIDTLRADRTTLYGAERDTTPGLASWAKSAMRFELAYTAGTWTSLALPSLFRGLYARRLRWTRLLESRRQHLYRRKPEPQLEAGDFIQTSFTAPTDDTHPTLPSLLSRRGMATEAVVNDGGSEFLDPRINLAGSFDRYTVLDQVVASHQRTDESLTRIAVDRLEQLAEANKPFFLWVHYYSTHLRRGQAGFLTFGNDVLDVYDSEIHFTDKHLTRLLAAVDRLANSRSIGVIVTSDHGESIAARRRRHGNGVTEDQSRIPLVVRGPGIGAGVSRKVVSLVDIMPTILTWTNTPKPGGVDGLDLAQVLAGTAPARDHVLVDCWRYSRDLELVLDHMGAIGQRYMLIWDVRHQTKSLWRTGRAGGDNLIELIEVPELDRALSQYMEQNGTVRVSD